VDETAIDQPASKTLYGYKKKKKKKKIEGRLAVSVPNLVEKRDSFREQKKNVFGRTRKRREKQRGNQSEI